MKSRLQILITVAALLSTATTQASDNRYYLILRGICKVANASGEIVSIPHTSQTIVADCAARQEPPLDPKKLSLVYDVSQGVALVVDRATGREICDVFGLETRSALRNAAGTQWELLINVNDFATKDEDGGALCSLGIEVNQGRVSRFRIKGQYHLVYKNEETGQPVVCGGTIATGGKFRVRSRR